MRVRNLLAVMAAAGAAALLGGTALAPGAAAVSHGGGSGHWQQRGQIRHVLLISVDGMHQQDLAWYVQHYPHSALADLDRRGIEYSDAVTTIPSDSFPATVGLMTGGDPGVTGFYYDDTYNYDVFPPGTTKCVGRPPGGQVNYDETDDVNTNRLDAGQGLTGLPGSILQMTSNLRAVINPATLPVSASTCKPIYPNQYLKVNTIFNVAHDAGLVTAWSDKHPVYTSFDGPEGNGITDSFDPEIDSVALEPDGSPWPGNITWTQDNAATMQYDSYKVQAVLNWIDGYNHQRTEKIGVPAIFGMNFQTVSTAEKLPTSDGLMGGDYPGTNTPGPLLQRALGYINTQLQTMVNEIQARGLTDSTAIVISAKHGQSPQDPNQLTRIDDTPIIAGVNAAWAAIHPGAAPLVVYDTDDDAIMWWLSDTSPEAARFVRHYLWTHTATGNTATGASRTLLHSGLARIYAGAASARYFGVPVSDPNHPDVWGVVQVGVVYTGGTAKIAEHGGANPADRDVPIVVYGPGIEPQRSDQWVETTQVAPTILKLLGLNPWDLQAVQIEGTQVLPGIH